MKIKINFPEKVIFEHHMKTRICDLNYGAHVGHQILYEYCHNARMDFLNHQEVNGIKLSELNFGSKGLVMASSAAQYLGEIFHPTSLVIDIAMENLNAFSFDLIYRVRKAKDNTESVSSQKPLSIVQTNMICFDYEKRALAKMDEDILKHFEGLV